MKHVSLFAALAAAAALCACGKKEAAAPEAPFSVYWDVENCAPDSTGRHYKQYIRLTGDLRGVDKLAFNQHARNMRAVNELDTVEEIVPGYYQIASGRFGTATGSDTIDIEIVTNGSIYAICYAPEGFHARMADGSVLPVPLTLADMKARKSSYATTTADYMPYGDTIYARNAEISGGVAGVYDIVPSFKDVQLTGGDSRVNMDAIEFADAPGDFGTEQYRITVADNKMKVECAPGQRARLAKRLAHNFGTGTRTLPNAVITDEPSLQYRGLMIDIARNFQQPAELYKILDWMAVYGLNVLHFHPIDDEGWRLEIKSLPELTEVGGRRGYTPGSDGTFTPSFFAGDGNPASKGNTANGIITQDEYKSILRYADSLGIAVIPEIETPGHARAAARAMELRAARLNDPKWLLQEAADTSRYTSAQGFHDNVMNPALPGPYMLVDMVSDEIIQMHKDAGVPLLAIHIGGDEVPAGAWGGSPAVAKMKEELGVESDAAIHAAFVEKISDLLAAKGVKTSGWQEIALNHSADYNSTVAPRTFGVNGWSTLAKRGQGKVVDNIAEAGFPVILSNAEHFYFDLCYSRHPDERGLIWAGTTDEFSALSGYPHKLCTVPGANLVGVQGQLWSETVRGPETLEALIFPKILGLAERGWNADSTYTEPNFHAVVLKEMPKWDAAGVNYHVRQPGLLMLDDNTFIVNTAYPDAVIRYTTDGTDPNEDSPVVKAGEKVNLGSAGRLDAGHAAIPAGFGENGPQVRVRQWVNGIPSVTTLPKE